jgi:predicted transcriptional regulator
MNRGDEFESLYNELDKHLRGLLDRRGTRTYDNPGFSEVVREVSRFNSDVNAYRDELIQYGRLRNAIVHERGTRGKGRIVAEPLPEVLDEFRAFVQAIKRPPTVWTIATKDLKRFSVSEAFATALRHMRENEYSQIVVQDDGAPVRVLTAIGISHWLEGQADEGMAILEKITLGDVLPHEPDRTFEVISRDASINELRDKFRQFPTSDSERLLAVIVTHSGKAEQQALGIITPWDMVRQLER